MKLILLICLPFVCSLIHNLKIQDDPREIFKIETFGFLTGGEFSIKVNNFHLSNYAKRNKIVAPAKQPGGFVLRRSNNEHEAQKDLETIVERKECLLNKLKESDYFLDLADPTKYVFFLCPLLFSQFFIEIQKKLI